MLGVLISLLILLVIFAIFFWLMSMIPIPAEFVWIVRLIVGVIFLLAMLSLLAGYWSFPFGGPYPAHRL